MTREEAKRRLLNLERSIPNTFRTKEEVRNFEALEMAIQALSQEPTTTTNNNEPITIIYPTIVCDDAIDREYLFKVLDDFCGHDRTATITLDTLADIVYELPSVTQKSGKWHIAHGMYEDRFWCSCGYIRIMDSGMNEWKYCPVCGGAKMVEPQESEDK